jgi:predicted transposase YbfD/YdcC
LGRIDHQKFEECFRSWIHGYFKERMSAGSVIALDGKTVRGSASEERKAIHIVSTWADELGLALGQVQTEEKSNEITAIPTLLEALDVSGCIVTIDAMGCQKAIAQDIVAKQGGYTLALKENHREVYAEAQELFEGIDEPSCSFPTYTDVTKDQGRIEKREVWLCTDLSWFAGLAAWASGLHPVHPDGEGEGYYGNPVLFDDPHGGGHLCPFGTNPLGDRKQTALGIGCGIPGRPQCGEPGVITEDNAQSHSTGTDGEIPHPEVFSQAETALCFL